MIYWFILRKQLQLAKDLIGCYNKDQWLIDQTENYLVLLYEITPYTYEYFNNKFQVVQNLKEKPQPFK